MRIIKKPKFGPITCGHCGCVFKIKTTDLKTNLMLRVKEYCDCPVCDTLVKVKFKEENHDTDPNENRDS